MRVCEKLGKLLTRLILCKVAPIQVDLPERVPARHVVYRLEHLGKLVALQVAVSEEDHLKLELLLDEVNDELEGFLVFKPGRVLTQVELL